MQLQKYDCQAFLFEAALSDPRNASTHKQTCDTPIIAHEMKFLQSQIDSLDLSFLEHISLADGLLEIQETHGKVTFDVDSDNDDSTADLTDDSVSIDEPSDRKLSTSVALLKDKSSRKIPCMMEERPSLTKCEGRPNFSSCVSVSIRPSSKALDSNRAEHDKLQIQPRKQKIWNESMKRQLEQSSKLEKVLQVKLQGSENENLVRVTRTEDPHAEFLDINSRHERPGELKLKIYLTEVEAIRAQLDANATRIRMLRSQRNEDAALSLSLELMIARLGIVSPESEQLILSVADLKRERKELRDGLRSAGINDAILDASVQQRVKDREFESTRAMQELSLRVQELQNDKNELSEQTRSLRMAMGNLRATALKLDSHIKMLESVYRPLTKIELEAFENGPGLPVESSLSTGRFSRIPRIFRRRL